MMLQVKYYGRDPASGKIRLSRKVLTVAKVGWITWYQNSYSPPAWSGTYVYIFDVTICRNLLWEIYTEQLNDQKPLLLSCPPPLHLNPPPPLQSHPYKKELLPFEPRGDSCRHHWNCVNIKNHRLLPNANKDTWKTSLQFCEILTTNSVFMETNSILLPSWKRVL